ncbi:L-amino acid N-acyltransferase YncA [Nocardioides albertanoniae]|uniref:L-amino acid N-acyltransferase YncA n=1 Tax=Nocardioides albertanoniae TaxID=1175486 RepID=A0A543A1B2_9ACTN|nr:GNAT family N-acetyltransferase [Nocardioides albertanoniae]TQL66388.1 L-amino acid N-acyltransferase YncA [Nocardioides albertanoniae]
MDESHRIRPARADDMDRLGEIEVAAGVGFRDLDMAAIADDDPPTAEVLAGYIGDGRAWVVTDETDRPVGYLIADRVDAAGHVEQVSVDPSHARLGLGAALIGAAESWARHQGFTTLTLTTFAEVPWNAPYYQRLGFRVVPAAELGDGLRRVREHEAELGLDRWPRVAMSRPVAAPAD